MKKTIAVLLSLLLLAALMPLHMQTASAEMSGRCGRDLYWSFEGGTLTISGSGDMYNYGPDYENPWVTNGFSDEITWIDLPDGLTDIGSYAFYFCRELRYISIPSGVSRIGEGAFERCVSLGSIELPISLTDIEIFAFCACNELTTVWYYGTREQKEQMRIGSCNDPLLNAAWYYGDPETACGPNLQWSFNNDTGVLTITGSGRMYNYNPDYMDPWVRNEFASDILQIDLPDELTDIGSYAFYSCRELTNINIPSGVTKLNEGAFDQCNSLDTIYLPASVTEIDYYAFTGCHALTTVYYSGTEAQRAQIHIADGNDSLLNATWYYQGTEPSSNAEWNASDVMYKGTTPYVIANGSPQRPRFVLKNSTDGSVIDPAFYDCEYCENTNAGTGYAVIKYKNGYTGITRKWFKIYLPPTTTTTVENIGNGIKLTWSPVEGAVGYVIYRRAWSSTTDGWTEFKRWNNTTETTYIDGIDENHRVYAGTRYQYGIKAYFARRVDPVTGTTIGGNVGDNYNLGEVGPLKTTVRITTRVLNSVTAGSRQMTVKWTPSKNFTGYQIQYATNAAFTQNAKAIKITNPKTAQTVIRSLTSGKTYYVRLRSYHEFNGMTYFGEWSNVKTCKVK